MTPGVELLLCLFKHSSYDILGVGNKHSCPGVAGGNEYSERALGITAKITSAELNDEEKSFHTALQDTLFFFFFVFETVSHLSQAGLKLTMQLRTTVNF